MADQSTNWGAAAQAAGASLSLGQWSQYQYVIAANTAATAAVWVEANTSSNGPSYATGYITTYSNSAPAPPSAEQLRRMAEAERAAAERARLDNERWEAACARAMRTLCRFLTEEQASRLARKPRCFEVTGHQTRRRYRLYYATAGNVRRLDEQGREVESYCIHPAGVPIPDTLLAQKLMLETDEPRFLRVANCTVLTQVGTPEFPPGGLAA